MSPLEDLLIDDANFDQDQLAAGLKDIVGITGSGEIRPLDGWESLQERGKVLALLLGLRAAELLQRRSTSGVSPTEVSEMSGVAIGTAKPVLRGLVEERLAHQPAPGRYAIPNHAVRRALNAMSAARRGNGDR